MRMSAGQEDAVQDYARFRGPAVTFYPGDGDSDENIHIADIGTSPFRGWEEMKSDHEADVKSIISALLKNDHGGQEHPELRAVAIWSYRIGVENGSSIIMQGIARLSTDDLTRLGVFDGRGSTFAELMTDETVAGILRAAFPEDVLVYGTSRDGAENGLSGGGDLGAEIVDAMASKSDAGGARQDAGDQPTEPASEIPGLTPEGVGGMGNTSEHNGAMVDGAGNSGLGLDAEGNGGSHLEDT